jgi:hypothetical protein
MDSKVKLPDVYDKFCDAGSDQDRSTCAAKVERAIRCAGDAPELQSAVRAVRQLNSRWR